MTQEHGLGRITSIPDERNNNFLLRSILPPTTRTHRHWNNTAWWGNQGATNSCVGFAFAKWIEDGPVTHSGVAPIVNPFQIYTEAQKIDGFPLPHEGTTIHAAAAYLKARGVIQSYHWGQTINDVITCLLELGPVVAGVNWYRDMFHPSPTGLIKVGGSYSGGHAFKIDGVNTKTELLRIPNSWGRDWGVSGNAFISFTDFERLLSEDGECVLAIENKIFT